MVVGFSAMTAVAAPTKPKKLTSVSEFAGCTQYWGADPCLDALKTYVKEQPAQAFDAGKAVTMSLSTHWAAIPFFDKALSDKADPARCADERLASSVESALSQPNSAETAAGVASAVKILDSKCWKELNGRVSKRIASGGSGQIIENACPVFEKKKQAAPGCEAKAKSVKAEPVWQALDPNQIQVEPVVKVYAGMEGQRVSMTKVKGRPYYLIKFEGVKGAWNGKVVLHREDVSGTGFDYWTQLGARHYVSVAARKPWGEVYAWEVYPLGGGGPYQLALDMKASQVARGDVLLGEFKKAN
jgi:hypothetical protein